MERKLIYLAFATILTACTAEVENKQPEIGLVTEITASTPDFGADIDTKTSIGTNGSFSWVLDDKLGFFPEIANVPSGDPEEELFYINTITSDASRAKFTANGWGLINGDKYYSYYPQKSGNTYLSVAVDYTGQTQTANNNTAGLAAFDYLHGSKVIPSDNSEINMEYKHIGGIANFVLNVPSEFRSLRFTKLTVSSSQNIFRNAGTYNPSQDYTTVGSNDRGETVNFSTSTMSNKFELTLGTGNGFTCNGDGNLILSAMLSPTNWAGSPITISLDATNGSEESLLTCSLTPSNNLTAGSKISFNGNVDIIRDEYIDLSANGTANCYIVAGAGKYKFRCDVKGNGVAVGSEGSTIAVPNCAYLVWESVNTGTAPARNSILTDVFYEDGYVKFEAPNNNIQGNAMIALLNVAAVDSFTADDRKTMWVWHIWRLNSAPSDNDYGSNIIFMDRNLGALNNTPGDVGAIGLEFQWGRPVPYLGTISYTYSDPAPEAKARIVNTTRTSLSTSVNIPPIIQVNSYPLNDVIGSPLQFIIGNASNRHWTTEYPLILWGASKTQYDPCPPGYKIPANFTGFALDGAISNTGARIKYGSGTSYWWPMTGIRGLGNGNNDNRDITISRAGHDCFYWTSESGTSPLTVGYGLNFNLNSPNTVQLRQASYTVSGNSVRCQKIN